MSLAIQGLLVEALAAYAEAQTLDPTLEISARSWNTLCWFGSLWGYATAVLDACERAVELAPENGDYHDSRGLARALTGDYEGAIEDFEFYIEKQLAPIADSILVFRSSSMHAILNRQIGLF